ncbi:MAG TPA: hypothetical protein VMT55_02465, partial [Candidatus Sulfotelmatobacter sp.]|nr:hypothetical protein [Candidatus Sulfotelmatobacter sp.]
VMLSGKADQQKGKVSLKLVARDLDLSNWGTYVVPYLDIKKGKTNLVLDLNDDRMDIQLAGAYDDAAFTVSGQVVNKLDLSISLKNADLKSVKEVVPAARAYDLSGIGSVDLAVSGPYDRIGAKISATVRQGQAYGQKFSGNIRLNYADDRLTIEGSKISAYNGTLGVKGAVDLSAPSPRLDLAADINGLDLHLIAGRAPVISGRISGKASIAGPADDLAGSLRSDLAGGSVMGQRIDRGEADFRFNQGKLLLDAVRLSSDTGNLSGSGSISMDRVFDLNASASGIRLKGSGALGEMQALVDHFNGNLSFRLDDAFIKAPLKNLIASGTTEVSDIRIGEQRIDRAGGGVSLYQGKIDLINSYLMRGASILYISGEAGLGMPTAIALSGNDVQLSDLKLLNFFLPTDLRDPT